jgi:hypothetical protein
MPSTVAKPTRVHLWGGWSIELPPSHYQRNDDGSWSAWGADWVVDIHIIETSGAKDGKPVSAERMLGESHACDQASGNGWIGTSETLIEKDGDRDVYRLAGRLGAENTLMSCWISYIREDQHAFAQRLMSAVAHHAPRAV